MNVYGEGSVVGANYQIQSYCGFWMNVYGEGSVVGANYQIQSYCGSSFPSPPRPNGSDGGLVAAIGLQPGRSYLGNNLLTTGNGNLTLYKTAR
jgi:hypothetical protein